MSPAAGDDDDDRYPTWQPLKVTLKGGQPWGFTLSGGAEVNQPLTIIKIDESGKAGRSGDVREGDRLLGVNDVFCRNSHAEALRLIESAFRTLTLTLWRSADPESHSVSSPHLHNTQLERRESSSRLQAAKHRILRSLRPGHSGWAEVSGNGNSEKPPVATPLDRNNQVYHSEGKGLKAKRKAWASERELHTSAGGQPSAKPATSAPSSADRSQSFSDKNRRLSLDDKNDCGRGHVAANDDCVDTQPPPDVVVYENLGKLTLAAMASASRKDAKERRSFRKLTKDSGYETNYSDYANLDSLGCVEQQRQVDAADGGENTPGVSPSAAEMTPRSRSPVSDRSSSPRYVHQRLHRAVTTGSTNINGSVRRAGSQGRGPASCSPPLQALNPGLGPTLARYPSSDSLHSYSSAATLTAGSVHSAKSSPSLCRDPAVREHDKWDPVGEEDYIEMVAKKEPPAPVLEESSAEPRCLSSKNDAPSYWDADEEASYASDLRSSSYLVINNRHGRPPAPHPPADSYPVSSQSSHYWPSSTQMDDFEPSDPGMSIVTSGVYYPPPSPPPAPERDPACLKDINYGPGHEKFPSWPMPPAPVNKSSNPNGSQRTKSWTDQTEYPKEKARPYLRPWMVKKQPVWAEPGLPDPGDFPAQKLRRPRAPLPPLDKDGRQYGDVDYNLPSPPERDSSHREKWREPVTEETLAKLAEMEEGGTPFLDQLRNDSLAIYWTDRGYKDDAHSEKTFNSRDGRESVATVVTNSSSNSSSDTLKCHGSLGDLSNYGHLNNNNNGGNNNQLIMNSPGSPTHVKYDVAHSAKVPPVERHNSECVLYYGISPVKKQVEKSPNIDTTKPPSVAERIHELERQSRSVPDLLKSSGLSELRPRPPAPATPASNASTPIRTPSKSGQILDAEKNRNELKALQKQAVMEFFERQTGKIRSPGYGTVSRSAVVNGTLPRTRPNNAVKTLQSPDGETLLADQQVRVENANSQEEKLSDQIIPLKLRSSGLPITDATEPVPERPPKKPSPADDCSRRIEEAARELRNLRAPGAIPARKPRAPDPPLTQAGIRCSSPDLPPPPPPVGDDYEPTEAPDDPFPPPPSPRQVQSMTASKPFSNSPSFKQATYHKDSYMVHRKERKFGANMEERYRRHISPASHCVPHPSASASTSALPTTTAMASTPTRQQFANGDSKTLRSDTKPPKPFVSPATWERNHNVRQPSTTVVFTSAELQAIRDKEKANSYKSTPELHPSASSPSLRFGTASSSSSSGGSTSGGSSSGSFKSSYRSPFEPRLTAASTTSSVSLDLLMDDTSDGDVSSQSPVSSLSVSPCHSRGDSQDSGASTSPPGSKASTLRPKRREEIECEELSKDFAKQLPKNDFLSSLLDPGPEHKSPADYVGALFDLPENEEEVGVSKSARERAAQFRSSAPDLSANNRREVDRGTENSPILPASSTYFTTSECKAKLLTRYSSDLIMRPIAENSRQLAEKKDELLERIGKKLSVLRAERACVEEETAMNEALGKAVTERVEAVLDAVSTNTDNDDSTIATMTRKDRDKFRTHVQEIDKITSLLLGLGGRLARAENALANLPEDASEHDRKLLEGKRDRLVEQLDEAKQLKETIDSRSRKVSDFLAKHLTQDELADYDHFVKMKAKLIIQAREIDEKIKLGEEQTAALNDALVTTSAAAISPLKS